MPSKHLFAAWKVLTAAKATFCEAWKKSVSGDQGAAKRKPKAQILVKNDQNVSLSGLERFRVEQRSPAVARSTMGGIFKPLNDRVE